MLDNVHPGEVLLEEFLKPLGVSQSSLARSVHVHPRHINEIVHGKRSVNADTAIRLSRFFGTSEKFWLGLQDDYDLEEARKNEDLGEIKRFQAANMLGKNQSDFMPQAASERAESVLTDQVNFSLDVEKFQQFTGLLDESPEPNEGLKRLLEMGSIWEKV